MIKNIFFFVAISFLASCSTSKKTSPYEFAMMSADVYDAGIAVDLPNYIQPYMDFDKNNTNHFRPFIQKDTPKADNFEPAVVAGSDFDL